ncbi:hypothetical protein IAU59_004872 [Kwoniella sp. CBS 9459]
MPFFQSFQDLKGFTNNINPLNLFGVSEQAPTAPQSAPATITSTNTSANATPTATRPNGGAIAGPGPSSAARRALGISSSSPSTPSVERLDPLALGQPIRPSATRQSSSPAPIRPSLKHASTSSSSPGSGSSDSSDNGTRRKSSGANVSIAEPEITGGGERKRTPVKRGPRPTSTASGMTNVSGVDAEGRSRRRKKPMDTYIIVKPPPTSGKNPLNLQIQLVVKPDRRGRDRSASGMSSRTGSMVGEGIIASAPPSPSSQMVDLPAEGSDISDSPDSAPLRSATPEALQAGQPSPESPKSVSAESESSGTGLKRSSSIRSSISTSTAATGSSSASGKRIEPMFNLAVHNVMQPTVVTDAATDVKVAKFHKRDLDITGVGVLVPSEVWHQSQSQGPNLFSPTSRASDDVVRNRPLSLVSMTTPLSPTISRSDDGKAGLRGSLDLKGFKFDNLRSGGASNKAAEGQESGAKKFFGKVFKKKTSMGDIGINRTTKKTSPSASFSSHDGPARVLSQHSTATATDTLHPSTAAAGPRSLAAPSTQTLVVDPPSVSFGNPTFGTAPLIVRRRSSGAIVTPDGAVTGLTAHVDHEADQFVAPRMERCQSLPIIPSNRPIGYTWTVKRWAKRNTEGWASHLVAAANAGLEMVGGGLGGDGDDEVVFEWVKLRVPSNAAGDEILRRYSTTGALSSTATRTRSRSQAPPLAPEAAPGNTASRSQTSLSVQQIPPPSPNLSSSAQASPFGSPRLDGRPEPVRKLSASVSPSRRTSQTTLDADAGSTHEDEDSDPEDSETPWTCSVWVKKTGQRQLLGTLTPAPHHPKVIGILKIPMGLDSVSLTDVKEKDSTITSKTRASSNNASRELAAKRVKEGIALSEENLKDVVCVTAMWLVAREEFGGLGRKKSRRGTAA